MGQKLVIVESPAKAKTIGKYLGKNYVVKASMGHIIDLPKSQLGVDIENNYNPRYITIRGKGDLLNELRKEAKKSEKVFLATDPDREGEAISWHLAKALKISESDKCRIEFNEITKNAIKTAIKTPRQLNIGLVDAQQARRVLDRLVGYKISPILWKKVKWGLSAGRVQSVALNIICNRENEIKKFEPKEYWTIDCDLVSESDDEDKTLNVKLQSKDNKKLEINNEAESTKIKNELIKSDFVVSDVKLATKNRKPLPPFTTSTFQQDANKKLNFSTKKSMSIAQQLYEGVDVGGHGTIGLITYMRTDSVRISKEAQENTKAYILSSLGDKYIPKGERNYKGKKNIQDAHEAIRPTYVELHPDEIKDSLKPDQYKIYSLIWKRFVASQMADCILNTITISVENGPYLLKASGSNIEFDGFMKIYHYVLDDEEESTKLPRLNVREILTRKKINSKQHFTQPPARYSEATLVKTLEENGIGRPSTYSPTVSTLLERKYVEREKKTLIPTELGFIVDNIISEYFSMIVDVEFTAEIEKNLDYVEEGMEDWKHIVNEFYTPLAERIEIAEKEIAKITIEDKPTDILCDKCGKFMVVKRGRFGDFLACPGYPDCKNTKPMVDEIDAKCPLCSGNVVIRKSKKGRKFYGCSNYPECKFVSWFEPAEKKCSKCNSFMIKKESKTKGKFLECSNKECKNVIIEE